MKQLMPFKKTQKLHEKSNALKQDQKTPWNKQWAQTRPKDHMKQAMFSNNSKDPWNKQCAQTSPNYPMKQAKCSNKPYRLHETSNVLK